MCSVVMDNCCILLFVLVRFGIRIQCVRLLSHMVKVNIFCTSPLPHGNGNLCV